MTISRSNPAVKKLLVTLLLLCVARLSALDRRTKITQFIHISWTGSQIPFLSVFSLAQATDGYIWIASGERLFRFDGVRFTHFDPVPGESIPPTKIRLMIAVRDGSVWVVFESGQVSRMRGGHVTTFSLQDLPQTNDLAEDRDGSIVAATFHAGLARFRDGKWQDIAQSLHYSARISNHLMFDQDGALWVLTDNRALRLAPKGDRFIDSGVSLTSAPLSRTPLSQASDGTVWLAENRMSAHTIWPENRLAEVKLPFALTILFDPEGSLWMGSGDGGIYRMRTPEAITGKSISLSSPEIEQFSRRDGLSGDLVISSLQDREGNLWFGTSCGLDRFRAAAFRRVDIPDLEHVSSVILLNKTGMFLIGTTRNVLCHAARKLMSGSTVI